MMIRFSGEWWVGCLPGEKNEGPGDGRPDVHNWVVGHVVGCESVTMLTLLFENSENRRELEFKNFLPVQLPRLALDYLENPLEY